MTPSVRFITTCAALLSVCYGAEFKPPNCVGNITEFPNCNEADSIARKCSDLPKQETIDCFCTQDLLNAYVGCKGELRQCVLGNSFDSDIDSQISLWQDTCRPYLPSGITTPVAPSASRELDGDRCKAYAESCAQLSQSITSCSSAFTASAALTSCRCQESIIALASACDIDGRESCIGTPLTTENIFEFRVCPGATRVLQASTDTGPITESATTSTAEGSVTGSIIFGPASATTTSSTGGSASMHPNMGSWMSIGLLISSCMFWFH